MHVRLLLPTIDIHCNQFARFDQLVDQGFAGRVLLAVVVGEVVERCNPVMLCGEHQELLARLGLTWHLAIERLGWNPSIGEIVETREIFWTATPRHFADVEQVLKRDLGIVPIPPGAFGTDA